MTNANIRIRTVFLNDRGQIVIPEDIRRDLGLKANGVLVLIEKAGHILLRRESDVAHRFGAEEEESFWGAVSLSALEGAWDEKDAAWDKVKK